jgi:hypothetical protein
VEYGRIVREAWSITVRTKSLWWLGGIAAAQVAVYLVVVSGLVAPMAALPALASAITASSTSLSAGVPTAAERLLVAVGQWLGTHWLALATGTALVLAAWLVLGVLDVAAQIGIVTQANAVAERRPASLRAGMRDGFLHWWRAVALLALAALPTMVYLLVMAAVVFFTVSLPLYLGQPPNPGGAFLANLVLSPLSAVVSVLSVPLAVLVQLALRFAVVDDVVWRPAFRSAWRLAKSNLTEIFIAYAVVALVSMVALLLFAFLAALLALIASVLFLGGALVLTSGDTSSAGRIALFGTAGFVALLFVAFQAVMFVWQSSVWTLVWRDRAGGRRGSDTVGGEQTILRGGATLTTEGSS